MTFSPKSWIAAAAPAFLLVACGLGTEIGNGFKDSGDKDGKSKGANRGGSADPAHETNASMPESQSDDEVLDAGSDSDDDSTSNDEFDLELDFLTANCASPFSELLESEIRLVESEADGEPKVILAISDGESWKIQKEGQTKVRLVTPVTKSSTSEVVTTFADGSYVDWNLKCSGYNVVEKPESSSSTIRQVSVTLSKNDSASLVTWDLAVPAPGTGDTTTRLIRVTIESADAGPDPLVFDAD